MIISHHHRLVYVQVPQTGSTALGEWMTRNLDAQDCLRKHTTLAEARRVLGDRIDGYLVVATVRDSLDQFVSSFHKIVRDGSFGPPRRAFPIATRAVRAAWSNEGEPTIDQYVDRFVRRPHAPVWASCLRKADVVIRYESLDDDLHMLAQRLGLADVPPIPRVNPTTRIVDDESGSMSPDRLDRVRRFHRPFRHEFGYDTEPSTVADKWRYEFAIRAKAVNRRRTDSLLRAKVAAATPC